MEEGGSFTREALLQAEARLAAKRAARAEAREIRMKELERQQKEIYQVQKKYYGLDTKFGDIEQWMEDSERYSRRARRNTSASDEDERMSVGSRGSLRGTYYTDAVVYGGGLSSKPHLSSQNGTRPSDYSCYLSSGSRASSRASSARASPVIEERPEKDFIEKGNRSVSSLSATTLASLGGTSSRRGSGDTSISVDTEASLREIKDIHELKDQILEVESKYMQELKGMKDSLAEVEEKYKKAMVSNAQLDNDKATLMYQVDILKDALMEAEEQLAETRREYEEKCKENEKQKHSSSILQFQLNEVKETLKQRDELLTEIRQLQQKQQSSAREISDLQETIEWKDKKIGALERQKEYFDAIRSERDALRTELVRLKDKMKKHGIAVGSVVVTNGEASVNMNEIEVPEEVVPTSSQDVSHAQQEMNTEQLDVRLQKVADDRESLLQQIVKLKAQLEERQKVNKMKNAISEEEVLENGTDVHLTELQRDSNRQICELKFKLAKSEQEITALEQNVIRLEGQVTRYKSATENSEKVEDELKSEKRKLQRELRSALDKIEELEVSNSHLVKRLEKMKANRSALLSQQ